MRGLPILGLLLTTLGLVSAPVAAQDATLQPSAAESCLMPPQEQRGLPTYPEVQRLRGSEGRVKVELSFAGPDQPPAVKVLESGDQHQPFIESVLQHVSAFRVPCLQTVDAPSRLVLDFSFKPDHRQVFGVEPVDPDRAQRRQTLTCLQHRFGLRGPDYPPLALDRNIQGRVLALLRFTAPDQEPQVEVFSRPRAVPLARAVRAWARDYRLPCLGDGSLTAHISFNFFIEDGVYGFNRDTRMMQFLSGIKGIQNQRVLFDFNTMACPFDVRLVYYQPYLPNRVASVGSWHPERAAFLRWLSQAELNLPDAGLDRIFGDSVTFTVPCTKIDHHPKE